jgi:hypothetical protein
VDEPAPDESVLEHSRTRSQSKTAGSPAADKTPATRTKRVSRRGNLDSLPEVESAEVSVGASAPSEAALSPQDATEKKPKRVSRSSKTEAEKTTPAAKSPRQLRKRAQSETAKSPEKRSKPSSQEVNVTLEVTTTRGRTRSSTEAVTVTESTSAKRTTRFSQSSHLDVVLEDATTPTSSSPGRRHTRTRSKHEEEDAEASDWQPFTPVAPAQREADEEQTRNRPKRKYVVHKERELWKL